MSKQLKVYCANLGEYIPVEGGMTLSDIYESLKERIPFVPVCARVNNKAEDLSFQVFMPKQVEFLPVDSPSGHRCYIRSLCMMLYRTVASIYPGSRLVISHSVSRGYYCRLDGIHVDQQVCESLKAGMMELVRRDLPFERKERLTTDVIDIMRAQGLHEKVELLQTLHELYTVYYRLDGIADTYNGNLVPRTGLLGVFDLIPYEEGLLLLGPDLADPTRPATPLPQPKLYKAFTDYLKFNSIIGIRDAGDVNEVAAGKGTGMMINVAEALHTKYIGAIADRITTRYNEGGARVVLIAGPSSSGKTTFTKRLAVQLLTNLLKPVMISLDNYFVDRHRTPRDESGDYDYESLFALDLELFNDHLNRLIMGEEIEIPYYNFERGEREYRGESIKLDSRSVLLIEGIHGLNPELTRDVDPEMKYRIYVSALTTLAIDDHNWVSTTDTRLLRRIIRDYKYRGASALDTIRRWPSVRRGEEKWIFPYQENADSMFNSSLLFELGVMRDEADKVLRSVPNDVPEYAEAHRLRKFLGYFSPIPSTLIPPTSLLREFLGGSSFHY
ncbi:MAG: nucleoside kinase [Duncaniella sp.]|uniref:nucleoside kinase n=1 Tax=Duncaniella sp. TaxID=2518496 RepID=UPI0023CA9279|nr:nucleoside kinase [Duncaniella sp.]MDE6090584.1 nucleoside kinase [Duncaniella sp.]